MMNLLEYLEVQKQALEAFPFKFDTCSYVKGPLKQPVFVCRTCSPSPHVICYSCSISCHGGHDLIELYDKRNALCDCATEKIKVTCQLNPVKFPPNQSNCYSDIQKLDFHNFFGRYCYCDSKYNDQTETQTMFQCIKCEDWFHERCISYNIKGQEDKDFLCSTCTMELPKQDEKYFSNCHGTFLPTDWRENPLPFFQNILFQDQNQLVLEREDDGEEAQNIGDILQKMDRVKSIEICRGFNLFYENIKKYLAEFVSTGRAVEESDIEEFMQKFHEQQRK